MTAQAVLWWEDPAVEITRKWAMPSGDTFSIGPIAALLRRWLSGRTVIVDPFAKSSGWGTITNDLDPGTTAMHHMDARDFLATLPDGSADAFLFDPPYSPRQISELYRHVGRTVGSSDTQNARLYREVKDHAHRILLAGGLVICCGWNSNGMGQTRGYDMQEILLVAHGGAHNDTIVTVESKR